MGDAAPRKKRARSSASPDNDDADRKRGRPRVDRPDESAADRRRTQIRMAQRAYRQRKETTLEELRIRVTDLSALLGRVNDAFAVCRDSLSTSGLSPQQLLQLQDTSSRIDGLVRSATDVSVNGSPPTSSTNAAYRLDDQSIARSIEGIPGAQAPQNVNSWLDPTALAQSVRPRPSDQIWGYNMYPADAAIDGVPSMNGYHPHAVPQLPVAVELDQGLVKGASRVVGDSSNTQPKLHAELPPPSTFSPRESTFGRWLHRACLEHGYALLVNPASWPGTYKRAFRLSLLGRDRAKITAAVRSILARGPSEPLDFWQAPLIHVGGAGTHYPRRDPAGNLLPMGKTYHVGIVGPQALALLSDTQLGVDMTVDVAGCEGEWFDPYDVQGYMEEKGIYVDPSNSFVHAEILDWPANEPLRSPDESSSTSTGLSEGPPFEAEQLACFHAVNADPGRWNETNMTLTGVGYPAPPAPPLLWPNYADPSNDGTAQDKLSNNSGQPEPVDTPLFELPLSSMLGSGAAPNGGSTVGCPDAILPPQPSSQEIDSAISRAFIPPKPVSTAPLAKPSTSIATSISAVEQTPSKRSVTIDLEKFISILTAVGVCLGRSPGFRRRDVDRALAMASVDVY